MLFIAAYVADISDLPPKDYFFIYNDRVPLISDLPLTISFKILQSYFTIFIK